MKIQGEVRRDRNKREQNLTSSVLIEEYVFWVEGVCAKTTMLWKGVLAERSLEWKGPLKRGGSL
jgi:hypothetical protein